MVTILGWIVAVLQGLAATTAIVLWRAVDGFRRRGAEATGAASVADRGASNPRA